LAVHTFAQPLGTPSLNSELGARLSNERIGGYGGSNKLFSVEHDAVWKEQLLKQLLLIQRRLHPTASTICARCTSHSRGSGQLGRGRVTLVGG
jgi:hypothetical protein